MMQHQDRTVFQEQEFYIMSLTQAQYMFEALQAYEEEHRANNGGKPCPCSICQFTKIVPIDRHIQSIGKIYKSGNLEITATVREMEPVPVVVATG